MNIEQPSISPADEEFIAAMGEIAAITAQLLASGASREAREINHGDYLRAAMGIVGSAYELAKLGGEDAVRAYADQVRKHADAVERALR